MYKDIIFRRRVRTIFRMSINKLVYQRPKNSGAELEGKLERSLTKVVRTIFFWIFYFS